MPQLLICILDLTIAEWCDGNQSAIHGLHQFLVFLHSYLALDDENRLCVIGCCGDEATYLFPSSSSQSIADSGSCYEPFAMIDAFIISGTRKLLEASQATGTYVYWIERAS